MTLIPGDGQITVLWDDSPVGAADKTYNDFVVLDSTYRKYDFQGFRLWRSRTGVFSSAGDPDDPLNPVAAKENETSSDFDLEMLGQWDLNDGIQTLTDGIKVLETIVDEVGDTVVVSADTFDLGTDTGLRFSYVDRGVSGAPLVNGFRYYYSIESYDFNSAALPVSEVSLSNGIAFPPEFSAIPRSDASSYIEAAGGVLHVDAEGSVLSDATPDTIALADYLAEPTGGTDALETYSVSTLVDAEVEDTHHTMVIDDVVPDGSGAATVTFHMEDASGRGLYIGGDALSLFTMNYDSTASSVMATVFNPSDTTVPLYELSMEFLTYSGFHQSPDTNAFLAVDSEGADVKGELGNLQIPSGQFDPVGFRGTDIVITWQDAGTDTLTLSVYDTGNEVMVPLVGEEGVRASNWEFDSFGGQPGGAYLIGTPSVFRMYVAGSVISVITPSRFPEAGDVWTLKQRSYSSAWTDSTSGVDYVVAEGRPMVAGTRYQVDLTGGGQEAGEIDLEKIRVVPNPYLGTARFEFGPNNRQMQFTNLPPECTIRIYTISGNLVRVLDHTPDEGGTEDYDLRTRFDLELASGNYYYHVTTPDGRTHLGRFAVIQ